MLSPSTSIAQAEDSDSQAASADEEDPWANVEEMIVLGSGTEGLLATAGTSMTAFDAGEIEAMGIEDVGDLAQFTPNLEIKSAGSTTATLFIRGVGLNDFTANGSGAVAVYQDDVPLNLPAIQLTQLFDVSEVQVLKGPIGTGAGRNATAGAIKSYSNKPSGAMGAGLRFDYGNYNYKDAEGYLEVPILADTLSSRFAFRFTKRDGLMRNRCAMLTEEERLSPTACGSLPEQVIPADLSKTLNNRHTWAIRGITRLVPPTDDVDMNWLLGLNFARVDQRGTVGQSFGATEGVLGNPDASGYIPPEVTAEREDIAAMFPPAPPLRVCRRDPNAPNCDVPDKINDVLARRLTERPFDRKPFEGDFDRDGFTRQSSWGGFLRGDWTLDPVTITSITGYNYYDRERETDVDAGPNVLVEFDTNDHAWQVTEELRIGGELEALAVSWETGAFVLSEELDFNQLSLRPVRSGIFPLDQKYEQKTDSFGIYGEFVWEILDDVDLEAGVRYNWERKEIDADVILGETIPICIGGSIGDGQLVCHDRQTFDHPTGMVMLKYFLTEEITTSVKFTHGWKGPQINVRDGRSLAGALDLAKPEELNAIEWGVAGSWFEDRLSLQGALFFYDYQNYQVFTFNNTLGVPPQRIVVNANDAQIWGAEFEAQVEPIERLVIDLRFGWLESKFLDFTEVVQRRLSPGPGSNVSTVITVVQDWDGNRLPNTPRFKVSLGAQYTIEMGRLGSLIPRYDLSWTDDSYFDQSEGRGTKGLLGDDFTSYTIGQKAYALHNARLTYRVPNGLMEVSGWVRNFTNERYKTTSFNASQGPRLIGNYVGDPRTYGLSVSVRY
jgi:iron complex outermembrane receptor protein